MEKEIVTQVQEAQRGPYRINSRRNMPRHLLNKLTKTKHKERILTAAREKQQITYKGNSLCLTIDLSAETLQARREWQDIFKILRCREAQLASIRQMSSKVWRGSACEYQDDELAGVARLSWRVSGR